MTLDEQKHAEAASWKRWQAEWGNTESGAHAFGWQAGYRAGLEEVERSAGSGDQLRAAIIEIKACIDHLYSERNPSGIPMLPSGLMPWAGPLSIIARMVDAAMAPEPAARRAEDGCL